MLRLLSRDCSEEPSYTSQSLVRPLGEQQHHNLKPRLVDFMGMYCFIALLPLKPTMASSWTALGVDGSRFSMFSGAAGSWHKLTKLNGTQCVGGHCTITWCFRDRISDFRVGGVCRRHLGSRGDWLCCLLMLFVTLCSALCLLERVWLCRSKKGVVLVIRACIRVLPVRVFYHSCYLIL